MKKEAKDFTLLEDYLLNLIIDFNEEVFDEESLALRLANDMKLFKEGKLYYRSKLLIE
jgi:hypothetical protein